MPRLILKNEQSPGDIVLLTAAVRDLHRNQPGRFITDIRTSAPELWENNPFIKPLSEEDSEVEVISCHYPLIRESNNDLLPLNWSACYESCRAAEPPGRLT